MKDDEPVSLQKEEEANFFSWFFFQWPYAMIRYE